MYILNFLRTFRKAFKASKLKFNIQPPYTHIVQIGDPVLRSVSKPLEMSHLRRPNTIKVIRHLQTIMLNDILLGISACQIGIPLRIMCIQCPKEVLVKFFTAKELEERQIKELPLQVWINPVIEVLDYSTNIDKETCSSVLSLEAEVKRYNSVSLSGFDEFGVHKKMDAQGFLARTIQHEMDHLNGIMYTDVMHNKTLKCTHWNEINQINGLVELRYYPKMKS